MQPIPSPSKSILFGRWLSLLLYGDWHKIATKKTGTFLPAFSAVFSSYFSDTQTYNLHLLPYEYTAVCPDLAPISSEGG